MCCALDFNQLQVIINFTYTDEYVTVEGWRTALVIETTSLVPRPPPFLFFAQRYTQCVILNTKGGEGLGMRLEDKGDNQVPRPKKGGGGENKA